MHVARVLGAVDRPWCRTTPRNLLRGIFKRYLTHAVRSARTETMARISSACVIVTKIEILISFICPTFSAPFDSWNIHLFFLSRNICIRNRDPIAKYAGKYADW